MSCVAYIAILLITNTSFAIATLLYAKDAAAGKKEWWENSCSPLEEQDGDDYDDDEHYCKNGAHNPKHLRLFHTGLHNVFILHDDGVRVWAGREGPLQRERV